LSVLFLLFALLSSSPGEPPDEAEVQKNVSAARRGDRAALARLYRWHVARVSRVVRPFARDDADAEDLVQETFVRAFSALDRYEPRAGARFVSWLCTVARNSADKRRRKLSRAVPVAPERFDESEHGGRDAETALEHSDLARALLTALAEVSERDRWVLCLRYGGELEVQEVAALTGQSAANVRKICERQRGRVLARLRELGFADAEPNDMAEGA
jgi:RNA polymerase sigma-70 factor (ECF subfamily)